MTLYAKDQYHRGMLLHGSPCEVTQANDPLVKSAPEHAAPRPSSSAARPLSLEQMRAARVMLAQAQQHVEAYRKQIAVDRDKQSRSPKPDPGWDYTR